MPAIEVTKEEAEKLMHVLEDDADDLALKVSGPHAPANRLELEKERRFLLSLIHRLEISTAADESLCS